MFGAQPGQLPILILNGQNIAIPSFVPAPVVGGEFSCPGGAGASATIQQHRITHDAAMRTPHYLIQENMAHRTKKLIFASATEAYMSGLFKDNSYFDLF